MGIKHEVFIKDLDWSQSNPFLVGAVTAQSDLKLYDCRSKKSILRQKICDYGLNRIKIISTRKCMIADSNANLWEFDYLKPSKERGFSYRRYRGFVGSLRDFDLHPNYKSGKNCLVATVGLGRHLTIHKLNMPRLPLVKIYLKQKLNCCLFSSKWETQYYANESKQDNDNENRNQNKEKNRVDALVDDANANDNNKNSDQDEVKTEIDSFLNDDDNGDEDEDEWNDEDEEDEDDVNDDEYDGDMDDIENSINDDVDDKGSNQDATEQEITMALGQDWRNILGGYQTQDLQDILKGLEESVVNQ